MYNPFNEAISTAISDEALLVAQDGTVRLAFVEEDYTRRLEPADLLNGLRTMAGNR